MKVNKYGIVKVNMRRLHNGMGGKRIKGFMWTWHVHSVKIILFRWQVRKEMFGLVCCLSGAHDILIISTWVGTADWTNANAVLKLVQEWVKYISCCGNKIYTLPKMNSTLPGLVER